MSKKRIAIAIAATVAAVAFIIVLITVLSGQPDVKVNNEQQNNVLSSASDFNGTWKYEDPSGQEFTAVIHNNAIEVDWLMDAKTSGLYWKGDFETDDSDGSILSKADRDALSRSLVGSRDKTKIFTYSDGKLQFKFGAMGITKVVTLEKQ